MIRCTIGVDGEQYRPVQTDGKKNRCDVCDLESGSCGGVCGEFEYNFGNFVVMKMIDVECAEK